MKRIAINALLVILLTGTGLAQESTKTIKVVAEQFVKAADVQDGDMLSAVLEPSSLQYVHMGGKLSSFSAKDYIKLIREKQLGGVPRKITFHNAQHYGKKVAVVVLNAVSHEYDFLYQLTLSKNKDDEWIIISIMTEIEAI